ncbi:MAG: LysM peptidoglycan-binding domain-containing protein [Halanaerobiales bacterium]|nr:LysM peptidoglycan-binding domain-containing protein [Halanaerobiales bacterium]
MVGDSLLYSVKPGETIWSIADKFEINPGTMICANDLEGMNVVYGGQKLIIPEFSGEYRREILGYYHGIQNSGQFVRAQTVLNPVMTSISPCWAEMNENGSITVKIDSEVITQARAKGIKVYLHVENFNHLGKIADQVLEKTQYRRELLHSIQKLLEEYSFSGVNIQLKNISPYNRDYLNRLIQEFAFYLHNEGFGVIVTLPAKTGDSYDSHWVSGYDYRKIGEYADYVVLESFDFHWIEGHPGPISPLFWVKDVLDYALMEIAEEKIIFGLPCYGYDWVIDGRQRGQILSYHRMVEIRDRNNAKGIWDEDSSSWYFRYFTTDEEHQVWFEDIESLRIKLDLVKKYHLGGIALWRIGMEDPEIWKLLESRGQ